MAIAGVAGRYPKARDLGAFWENLCNGIDSISEIPASRWDHSDRTSCKWGGFIDGVDEFDPLFFNISPRDAESIDPQARLFLQTAWHALEDAGYSKSSLRQRFAGRVGVFVGAMYNEYQLLSVTAGAISSPSLGSIANRVSYCLDLTGPSLSVDTSCSSSLTALHLAVESLRRRECDAAIAGGVNLSLHPVKYLAQAQLQMSSSSGRCRSFGAEADGIVPAEGVGAVLLKRHADAIADGDHIYGLIAGSTINASGRTLGYTVPSPHSQAQLIADALRKSGVHPRAISYVEAHGTGTSLGDPIEIAGLTQAFREFTADRNFCSIGSLKSNIGNCEAAAGIAALTKVLLQMKHRLLVPTLYAETPNAAIDFDSTPFRLQQKTEEWRPCAVNPAAPTARQPLLAAISSFGAGGANAHVIVEECLQDADQPEQRDRPARPVVVVLSAKSTGQLVEQAANLLGVLDSGRIRESELEDVAYTLQVGREALEERFACVGHSLTEICGHLRQLAQGAARDGRIRRGTIQPRLGAAEVVPGRDLQSALDSWAARGDWATIADEWVKGADIPWARLHR
ncbi:MAG: type I polyketide synthase, partial [Steroidobacteraceae bacterium]